MKKLLGFIIILLLILIGTATYSYLTSYYTVAFIVDGTAKKVKIKKDSKIVGIDEPKKDGYKFLYWMDDYKIVDDDYIVKNDTILVALFEKNKEVQKYTVSFDTDGGSEIAKITVNKDEKLKEPEEPKKDGFIFKSWLLNNEDYDFNKPVTSNITLKASYIKENVKTYTITFNTDGGSYVPNKMVEANGKISKPSNPIKKGYHFKYWSLDGTQFNFNTNITKNITLKAIYELDQRKTYTVSFDSAGGSEIYSQTIPEGERAVIPTSPVKSGYIFVSWLLDNNAYDFNTPVTKNLTLKALYKEIDTESKKNSYVINFNTNGGSTIDIQLVEENNKVIKPNDPIKEGYTFNEWKLNGRTYDFNDPVTSEFTLFAEYENNNDSVASISYDKPSFSCNAGASFSTLLKTTGWNETIKSYSVSDNAMAELSKSSIQPNCVGCLNLEVTCKKAGNTTLIAESSLGSKTSSTLEVNGAAASISYNQSSFKCSVGQSLSVLLKTTGWDETIKSYSVSDSSIVELSKSSIQPNCAGCLRLDITCKNAGNAKLFAESSLESKTSASIIVNE